MKTYRILLLGLLFFFIFSRQSYSQYGYKYRKMYNATYKYQRGQFDVAQAILNELLNKYPDFDSALALRGLVKMARNNFSGAITDFTKCIALDSSNADAYFTKGMCYVNLNQFDSASINFLFSGKYSPNDFMAFNNKAYCDIMLKKYDEAIDECNKSLEINPRVGFAYSNRAIANFNLNNYDVALVDFNNALKYNPACPIANSGLIKLYLQKGDTSSACKYYNRAKHSGIKEVTDSINISCPHSNKSGCYTNTSNEWLEYFKNITSWGNNFNLIKWNSDIRINLKGEYTKEDVISVKKLIDSIQPLILPLKISFDTLNPNVTVHVIGIDYFSDFAVLSAVDMKSMLGLTIPEVNKNNEITGGTILMKRSIYSQGGREWVLFHELGHLLGLGHCNNSNSKFREKKPLFGTFKSIPEDDKLMIKWLYCDLIFPGFTEKDIDITFCENLQFNQFLKK